MQSIVDMPNRDNVRWFEDGTYQGRIWSYSHLWFRYAVFKKSTAKEDAELKVTGVKNLPPQQTPVDTFESDVMGITSISPIDENPSSNTGSSFESDVMGNNFY